MSVYRYTELDLKKINYKKPEKQGLIYYTGIDYKNEPLYLQTPKLILTKSGLNTIESKDYYKKQTKRFFEEWKN